MNASLHSVVLIANQFKIGLNFDFFSFLGGKPVKSGDYDALLELATICSLCNDSSVDYNEVIDSKITLVYHHIIVQKTVSQSRQSTKH